MKKKQSLQGWRKINNIQAFTLAGLAIVAGFLIYRSFASNSCGLTMDAPAHNYTREDFRGVVLNRRTITMLKKAESITDREYSFYQGSYNAEPGVPASYKTHDGGGALDINTSGMTASQINNAVKALRKAGFAAWFRTVEEGGGQWTVAHIHAIALGDNQRSDFAKTQVDAYWNGKSGLADNAVDKHLYTIGRPAPSWALGSGNTRYCP